MFVNAFLARQRPKLAQNKMPVPYRESKSKFGQISEVAQALVPLCCFTEGILTGFCFSMRYPLWMATAASRCRSQPTFISSELMPSLLLLFHVTGASGSC